MAWFAKSLGPSAAAARTRILREADDWIVRFGGIKVWGAGWDARLIGEHESVRDNVVRYVNAVYPSLWQELGDDLGLETSTPETVTLVIVTPECLRAVGRERDSILAETGVTGIIACAEARIVAVAGTPADPDSLAWRLTRALSFFVALNHLKPVITGEQSLLELAYGDYGAVMLYHTRGWHPWFRTLDLVTARQQLGDSDLLDLLQCTPDQCASDVLTDRITLACLWVIFLHELGRWQDPGRRWLKDSLHPGRRRAALENIEKKFGMDRTEIQQRFLQWLDQYITEASAW